jgi:hypothetical protein
VAQARRRLSGGALEDRDRSRHVGRLQAARRIRLHEMATQWTHVDVIVDDHEAAHGVLSQPGGDLVSAVGAGRAGRRLVDHAAGEALRVQHRL